MNKLILILIACFGINVSFAQVSTDSLYRDQPRWIAMMDEEGVNYNEAVKAFTLYWQDRAKPHEEEELFESAEAITNLSDTDFHPMLHIAAPQQFAFEYKKFMYWKERVLPFVKEDGTLMTPAERIARWKEEQAARH